MIGGLFKSASRVAIVAAAGIFAGSMSAQAADLGGNCCADLEERVAELEATTARKGNRRVSLTVFGQVNKSLLWHDDEDGYREGKLTVWDNDASMSRFGFRGSAKIRPDLEAGYVIVIGLQENKGTSFSVGNSQIRENYVYLDSATMGRVSIGQTSQVTDGLYEINLANALVTPAGMDNASSFLHTDFVNTFNTPFDGARRQGVYYRTPTLAGFILSAGYSHDTQAASQAPPALDGDATDYWEVALRYAGEFNGIRIAAGLGYRNEELLAGGDNDVWMGSGSVMHTPTGLFVSGGYAQREGTSVERDGYWVMAGIEKNWFGPGATTLFGEYSNQQVDSAVISDGTYWGLGLVQKIDAAATDLYINYRNYDLDGTPGVAGVPAGDANVVVGGMIIRF